MNLSASTAANVGVETEPSRLVIPVHAVAELDQICRRRTLFLPDTAAAVTVVNDAHEPLLAFASGPGVADVEEYGFSVGEGPAMEAFEHVAPVLISSIDEAVLRRWPAYSPVAFERGCRCVFAFPLVAQNGQIGTLTLYGPRKITLSAHHLEFALRIAHDVAVTVTKELAYGA